MERGDVEAVLVVDVADVIPPGVARLVRDERLEVGGRRTGGLEHVNVRKGPPRGLEVEFAGVRGRVDHLLHLEHHVARRLRRDAVEDLGAGAPEPAQARGQLGHAAEDDPEVAQAAAGGLGKRGRMGRVAGGGELHLVLAQVGAAVGADPPVRPGLLGEPRHHVVAVAAVVARDEVLALGLESAAHVLDGDRKAVAGEPARRRVLAPMRHLAVGGADLDDRQWLPGTDGEVEVGGQPDAVAHGDHVRGVEPHLVGAFGTGEWAFGRGAAGAARGAVAVATAAGGAAGGREEQANRKDGASVCRHGASVSHKRSGWETGSASRVPAREWRPPGSVRG